MPLGLNELAELINKANIPAINNVETTKDVVVVEFEQLNDPDKLYTLYCVESGVGIEFMIPWGGAGEFGANTPQILFMCWMHANYGVPFGNYEWNPEREEIKVYGALPPSEGRDVKAPEIEWALGSLIRLLYTGILYEMKQSSLQDAMRSGIISEEQAGEIIKARTNRMVSLLGLPSDDEEDYAETGI